MKKVIIIICLICLPSYGNKNFEDKLTTLDRWQKATNVLVVQVEEILTFSINPQQSFTKESKWVFAKIRIKDIWSKKNTFNKGFFYISYPYTKKEIGKTFIGAYGPITTMNSYPGRYINHKLNSTDNIYLTLWYPMIDWPVLKNKSGKWYISACIDGLTKTPLINPLLEEVKQLAIPKIDKKPSTRLLGFFWPGSEKSTLNVKTCKKNKL